MADIIAPVPGGSDYLSPYDDINYSKGPKILYGDPDKFQLILNDPQTDDDDEWGRTEEIAFRMITDELDNIHGDFYGYSTIRGAYDKVQILVNYFVGLEASNFLNPQAAVLTIGGTQLSDGVLSLATGTGLTQTLFSMDSGALTIASPASGVTNITTTANTNITSEISVYADPSSPYVIFTFNGADSYVFSPTSLALSGIALSSDRASFGSLAGGAITGNSLALSGNLTFPTSTSGTNPLSNYIFGTQGGLSDTGDVLTLTSNHIQLWIKTEEAPYTLLEALWFEVDHLTVTANIESYLNIKNDVSIMGTHNPLGYAILNFTAINSFINYTCGISLSAFNDGTVNRWNVTGAAIFDFVSDSGGTFDTSHGIRFLSYDNYNTGLELRTQLSGGQNIEVNMLLGTGSYGNGPTPLYGLTIATTSDNPAFILNGVPLYVCSTTLPTFPNYVALDSIAGISTGQNSMKWKAYDIPSISWPDSTGGDQYISVQIPLETLPITDYTWGTAVSVLQTGAEISSGYNTFSVAYYYNAGFMTLGFYIPKSSLITAGTVSAKVIIYYSNTPV
jgi:hypothetical protein